ncbi:MAG: hypothetical protein GXP63_07655 [DPANN group archaeon]|nr:hypothetical protein [DPANN group archaeon]
MADVPIPLPVLLLLSFPLLVSGAMFLIDHMFYAKTSGSTASVAEEDDLPAADEN